MSPMSYRCSTPRSIYYNQNAGAVKLCFRALISQPFITPQVNAQVIVIDLVAHKEIQVDDR
jgi:hypothetical protein